MGVFMLKKLYYALFLVLLAACGGGGGSGGDAPSQPDTPKVTGTVYESDLILGKTVRLKDAKATSAADTATDAAKGTYSVDVNGLTAPYVVSAQGSEGTLISFSPSEGAADINPITSIVIAMAAGTTDIAALFKNITPGQIADIKKNYLAKAALLTDSLQAVLPPGVKASDYFTGTPSKGGGLSSIFARYRFIVNPVQGIMIQTRDNKPVTLLTIPTTTISANTNAPLPVLVLPEQQNNVAPVANAGSPQQVKTGDQVTLDGSASRDENGDTLTYKWRLTTRPGGSNALLSNSTSAKPTFIPDVPGAYIFSLVVNDGKLDSAVTSVTITASSANKPPEENKEPDDDDDGPDTDPPPPINSPPVANAGTDQQVFTGSTVTLDGSKSYDADGDTLAYEWSLTSRPIGSSATLSNPAAVKPTFVADVQGTYAFNLTVKAGSGSSVSTVKVEAKPNSGSITIYWK